MKRPIKFKRVFQHSETGRICMTLWGNITYKDEDCTDWSSFKSPSQINGYYPIADLQFTGLKDKNGKEIYEGDILKYDFMFDGGRTEGKPDIGIVEFGKVSDVSCKHQGFGIISSDDNKEYKSRKYGELLFRLLGWELEVIGNIYENPELL